MALSSARMGTKREMPRCLRSDRPGRGRGRGRPPPPRPAGKILKNHFLQMPFPRIWDSIQYSFVLTQCITLSHCFNNNNLLCLLRRTKDFFCFFFILCFLEGVTANFSRKGGKSGNIDLHYSLVARRIDLNWSYTWNVFLLKPCYLTPGAKLTSCTLQKFGHLKICDQTKFIHQSSDWPQLVF